MIGTGSQSICEGLVVCANVNFTAFDEMSKVPGCQVHSEELSVTAGLSFCEK
jgi:hypothetical protein